MAAGSIIIDLLMKTGSFETDTKRAEARLKDLQKTIKATAADFGLSAVGIGAATTALLAWTKATVDGVDALNDFADATGTTVENASALEDVALRSGASFDTAQTALVKFNAVLKDMKPDDTTAGIFKQLGLDAERLKSIDPAQALLETAQALSQFADDGYKARIVQELFGKSVKEVAPLLKDLAAQGKLVATVTADQAAAAETFNKSIFSLQKGITDLSRQALSPFIEMMAKTADGFNAAGKAGKSYFETLTTEYWKWARNTWAKTGLIGPAEEQMPEGSFGEPEAKPSLLRNRQQMGIKGGGIFDWEANEERRKKAAEAAEEAIRKAREATRELERRLEQERRDAWEIEKNNIMRIFEAEAKIRQEGAAVYEATRTPLEQLNAEQERLSKLLEQGAIDWDTYGRAVMAASEKYDASIEKVKKVDDAMTEFSKNAAENMQRAFGDDLVDMMEGNFKDIGDGFIHMINRMVAEALAAKLTESLFGKGGQGGMASGALAMVGSFMGFGGAKAGGGDVAANTAYLVGEKGPELFVPRAAGNIIPNGGDSGGKVVNITVNQAFAAGTDRRTTAQAAADAQRALSTGARNL